MIVSCDDICAEIVSYIANMKDMLSWKSLCKLTYNRLNYVSFTCTRYVHNIIPSKLDLSFTVEPDNLLKNIKEYGHHLISLVCSKYVNNEMLSYMPNLRYINCLENFIITDEGIKHLPFLRYLDCGNSDISMEILQYVTRLETLISRTESYFGVISNIPTLKTLDCKYNVIYKLSNLPNLTYLRCGKNFKIEGIETLSSLRYLICSHSFSINDNNIQNLINLVHLDCGLSPNVSDLGLMSLSNLTQLKCGNSVNITNNAFEYLPNLTHLDCGSNTSISNDGLRLLKKLKYLYCSYNPNITDLSVVPSLEYVNCGRNSGIRDISFKNCNNIIHLDCWAHHKLTDLTLLYLPNLVSLSYRYKTNFSNGAIANLKKLKHISCSNNIGCYMYSDLDIECITCSCDFAHKF